MNKCSLFLFMLFMMMACNPMEVKDPVNNNGNQVDESTPYEPEPEPEPEPQPDPDPKPDPKPEPEPTPPVESNTPLEAQVSIKRFDQIYNTYANVTGVTAGSRVVREEYLRIRASLPLHNDANTLTPFSIVGMTSLAFVFCQEFVKLNQSGSTYFGIASSNADYKNLIADKMIRAMAYTDLATDPYLQKVKSEMVKVMTHTSFVEDGVTYRPVIVHGGSSASPASSPYYESIQGCALFLSSPYFVFNKI